MKPRQAFDAEREEAAALPRPARRDPALAMAKRQVLVLLGAWLAVRALLMRCWQARRTRIFGSAERWGSPSVFW